MPWSRSRRLWNLTRTAPASSRPWATRCATGCYSRSARARAAVSQLAATLRNNKGNIAHHLKVLADAGLVLQAGTRQVLGGTKQYYRRACRSLQFNDAAITEVAFSALAADIATAEPEPFLVLRALRLSDERAEQITAVLRDLADDVLDRGGHFLASEDRHRFVTEIRQTSRPYRGSALHDPLQMMAPARREPGKGRRFRGDGRSTGRRNVTRVVDESTGSDGRDGVQRPVVVVAFAQQAQGVLVENPV